MSKTNLAELVLDILLCCFSNLSVAKHTHNVWVVIGGLTTKAEPPPIRGVDCNRSGNGGWLRRLVRHHCFTFGGAGVNTPLFVTPPLTSQMASRPSAKCANST